jgi:hypothetical protein
MTKTLTLLRHWGIGTIALLMIILSVATLWSENAGAAEPTSVSCSATLTGTAPTITEQESGSTPQTFTTILSCNWSGGSSSPSVTEADYYDPTTGLTFTTFFMLETCTGQCTTTIDTGDTNSSTVTTTDTASAGYTNTGLETIWNNTGGLYLDSGDTAGGVYSGSGGSDDQIGVITLTSAFGVSPPCTALSQSGFYNTTADGTSSYSYTYTYSGEADQIVGAPNDDTGDTTTIEGKTFPADSTDDTTPTPNSVSVSVTPLKGTDPNKTEFWCYTPSTGWVDWGNATSAFNTGAADAPCVVASVTGYEFGYYGKTEPYTFAFTQPGETNLVIELSSDPTAPDGGPTWDNPPPSYHDSETVDSKSFNYDFDIGEQATVGQIITAQLDFSDLLFPSAGNDAYLPQNAEAWCDSSAGWVDLGALWGEHGLTNSQAGPPSTGDTGGTSNSVVDCSNFPNGFDLGFNIGADIENSVKWGVCAVEWLVKPTFCSIQNPTQDADISASCVNLDVGDVQNRIPIVYFTDTIAAITTFKDALSTAVTTDECSAPDIAPFTDEPDSGIWASIHSWSVALPAPADLGCSGPEDSTAGELFGYRVWLRTLLLIGMLLGFVGFMWRMMPWSKPGDIEILEKFQGLNNDGDYIDTYQTDERSDDY